MLMIKVLKMIYHGFFILSFSNKIKLFDGGYNVLEENISSRIS